MNTGKGIKKDAEKGVEKIKEGAEVVSDKFKKNVAEPVKEKVAEAGEAITKKKEALKK